MTTNHVLLPALFIQHIEQATFSRPKGSWELKANQDSFGNLLETELTFFESVEQVTRETQKLPTYFRADGVYGAHANDWDACPPGFIPDILDFREIVCFGESGDGSPFCFDYRSTQDVLLYGPSVIWWDDVYWRSVSQCYQDFIALFNLPLC